MSQHSYRSRERAPMLNLDLSSLRSLTPPPRVPIEPVIVRPTAHRLAEPVSPSLAASLTRIDRVFHNVLPYHELEGKLQYYRDKYRKARDSYHDATHEIKNILPKILLASSIINDIVNNRSTSVSDLLRYYESMSDIERKDPVALLEASGRMLDTTCRNAIDALERSKHADNYYADTESIISSVSINSAIRAANELIN